GAHTSGDRGVDARGDAWVRVAAVAVPRAGAGAHVVAAVRRRARERPAGEAAGLTGRHPELVAVALLAGVDGGVAAVVTGALVDPVAGRVAAELAGGETARRAGVLANVVAVAELAVFT